MEKVFTILATGCAGTAIVFFFFGNQDATFVLGVIGCVLWFLGYRSKVKANNDLRAKEHEIENVEKE